MIETATRGSALGFIVGILFMATAFAFFERKRLMIRNVGIAVLVITVLAIGGIFALKNSPVIKNSASLSRLSTLATTNFAQFADTEGAARFQIWKMALKGAEQRPILGWGQESFNYLFYKYYSPAMYTQEPWFDRAHDVFLDWLTAGGVLGLLTYLSLFYFTLWYIWKKKVVMSSSGKDVSASMDFSEKITLTALLIAYFIHNIFVFDNIASYIMFFSLLAYIQYRYSVSFGFVSKSKSEAKAVVTKTISLSASDTSDENDGVSSETVKMVAAVLIGIATLAGGYYINVPAIHASMLLVDALSPQQNLEQNLSIYKQIFALPTFIGKYEAREQLTQLAIQIETATSAQVPDATKVDIVNYAYSQMQEQLKETPNDLRYYYFMGELLNTYGQFQGALPVWQKAVELSPNRQLMLISLGEVQEQLGDSTDAIANFKKAYMLDTDYSDAAEIYFQAAGLYSQLVTLMQQQIASDPTNVNDYFTLAQAYDGLKDKTDALAALNQIITINPTLASQMQTYITEAKTGKPLQ
jgi:tetratricopeptide (TPR) repeat protein